MEDHHAEQTSLWLGLRGRRVCLPRAGHESDFSSALSAGDPRRLRIHSGTATVPIIVITSETRRQDGELSIKAGANIFLERPVPGEVLREHVAHLLIACGRLPRQSSPKHEPLGSPSDNPHREPERTCPQCSGVMEYRHKWPVVSTVDPNSREPRERLRDVSGWFCSDQECGYQELARRTG